MKTTPRLSALYLLIMFNCLTVKSTNLAALPELKQYVPTLSPLPVYVAGCTSTMLDLSGTWKFNPAPASDFYRTDPSGWANIQVPSEWVMQGFSVSRNTFSGYSRMFSVPTDWKGKRVKLRCDGIYSDAVIYVNGERVGAHQGGFTPFELDITDLVQSNRENRLSVMVKNETLADTLSSGSKYACHPLGGINRKIKIFALPNTNISSLYVNTKFDKEYKNATLNLQVAVSKEGKSTPKNVSAQLQLTSPAGVPVQLSQSTFPISSLAATMSLPIERPLKWDNEHPNLYLLTINLFADGVKTQTIQQKIGFRQVEVRGNEMFVNGMPVKLRGSNHHEVYPVTGRSVPDTISVLDVRLFREANVNLLRTCHYPPDETLIRAADSLGMFIECEAPFCWAPGAGHEELVCRQTAEMALAYRNSPSVLFWSLANESEWGKDFESSSALLRDLDPDRPQTFNYWFTKVQTIDENFVEIANIHYPDHDGPAQARTYTKRPVYLGEECHLNAYNRLELATDPGLRDMWGRYIREMWDDIDTTEGCLGQSVWSGIDDTFYMPDGDVNGYGTWGPLDGWRRLKPEYWGMKKAYSPIRLLNYPTVTVKNNTIRIPIRNRQNFGNISEMKITWTLGNQNGVLTSDIPPVSSGELHIKLRKSPRKGEKLGLKFYDPRGFLADEYMLPLENNQMDDNKVKTLKQSTSVAYLSDTIKVMSGKMRWLISRKQGKLIQIADLPVNGPQLMVLPLNSAGETQMIGSEKVWTPFTDPCAKWQCDSTWVETRRDSVFVTVQGAYEEAVGKFVFQFANGSMTVNYNFHMNKSVNPRQIGLVFSIPGMYDHFSWERVGYWDVYPSDHIARLKGSVSATEGFPATSVGPRTRPSHPWRLDNLPYGNNDFCSTKNNVIRAGITDGKGNGLTVNGQGVQHVRCWKKSNEVNVLVADYSNGGSERFLRGLARRDDKPLKKGDEISGNIQVGVEAALKSK